MKGFWRQFHLWYFRLATYWQGKSGILIYKQSQLQSTDAQAQWPVYWSWLYAGDSVKSCPPSLVQDWLSKGFQPTIRYRYMVKYLQSPSFPCPVWSGRAILLPHIPTGTSFERNPCPRRVQKCQINIIQRSIRRFGDSQLLSAILCTNWRGLGARGLWNGARIWSEYTHRQYIYQSSQWAVVLPSTISLPYICWVSDLIAR